MQQQEQLEDFSDIFTYEDEVLVESIVGKIEESAANAFYKNKRLLLGTNDFAIFSFDREVGEKKTQRVIELRRFNGDESTVVILGEERLEPSIIGFLVNREMSKTK